MEFLELHLSVYILQDHYWSAYSWGFVGVVGGVDVLQEQQQERK
jgi:hypothetical protein